MRIFYFLAFVFFLFLVIEVNAESDNFGPIEENTLKEGRELRANAQAPLKLRIELSGICGGSNNEPSVGKLNEDLPDLYLKGQVLYYPDPNSKTPKVGEYLQTKPQKDTNKAVFKNILTIKNETNSKKLGVYIEVWDDDSDIKTSRLDEFIGSVTLRGTDTDSLDEESKSKLKGIKVKPVPHFHCDQGNSVHIFPGDDDIYQQPQLRIQSTPIVRSYFD